MNSAVLDKHAIGLLGKAVETLSVSFPSDWLSRFEILELDVRFALKAPWMKQVLGELAKISKESKAKADLITCVLMILKNAKVESTCKKIAWTRVSASGADVDCRPVLGRRDFPIRPQNLKAWRLKIQMRMTP